MIKIETIVRQEIAITNKATVVGGVGNGFQYFTGLKITRCSLLHSGGGRDPHSAEEVVYMKSPVYYKIEDGEVTMTDSNGTSFGFALVGSGQTESDINSSIVAVNASGGGGSVAAVSNTIVGTTLTTTVDGITSAGVTLPSGGTVVDGLTSTSTTSSLSANQGKVLKDEQDKQTSALGQGAGASHMGTYTGSTITDNQTAKQNLQEIETALEAIAQDSVFAPNTSVAQGTAGTPTPAEMQTYVTADGTIKNTLVYFNGTDVDDRTNVTYAYWADKSGNVVQLYPTITAGVDRLHVTDTNIAPTFAGQPLVSEIQVYVTANPIQSRLLYYTGDDNAASVPTYVYDVDNSKVVTQLYPSPKKARQFFSDTDAVSSGLLKAGHPSVAEVTIWALANNITDVVAYYTGNDTATDAAKYVFDVDSLGVVTLIQRPEKWRVVEVLAAGASSSDGLGNTDYHITNALAAFDLDATIHVIGDKIVLRAGTGGAVSVANSAGNFIDRGTTTAALAMQDNDVYFLSLDDNGADWVVVAKNVEQAAGTVLPYDAEGVTGNAIVKASASGVTASRATGVLTVTVPTGEYVQAISVNGETADLSGSNDFEITFDRTGVTGFDQDNDTLFLPDITVINTATEDFGGPTGALAFIYDYDNDPQRQVIAAANGDLTVRIINLNAYSKWVVKVTF